jgi:MscS family membrane protein
MRPEILIISFIVLCAFQVLLWFIYHQIKKYLDKTHLIWTNAIIQSIFKPLIVLMWFLLGLYFLQFLLPSVLEKDIFKVLPSLGISLLAFWFGMKFINTIENTMKKNKLARHHYDPTTVEGIAKICRILLWIIFILVILQISSIPLAAIYTVAGGAGLGITLAAQDLLKNIFGGFVLYLDRPFSIGDDISCPGNPIEGTVETIGWRATRIRTPDFAPLYIPNATFLTLSVKNSSRLTHRLIQQDIAVSETADTVKLKSAIQDIGAFLKTYPKLTDPEKTWVEAVSLINGATTIRLYALSPVIDKMAYQKLIDEVLMKALSILASYGISLYTSGATINFTPPQGNSNANSKSNA